MNRFLTSLFVLLLVSLSAHAADHFLTIGGGGSPHNNQLSLERNVVFFRHTLGECGLASAPHEVFFACGNDKMRDLQFADPNNEPPRANVLLARLFDREGDLYQSYRQHTLSDISGPANRAAIKQWFDSTGARLADGDRLFIYFTGHGGPGRPARNTTMDLWFDGGMTVKEFVPLLDKLNPKVKVVLIMVQCHSGGFGDVIFKNGDAGPLLSDQSRCGFFATWNDRLAAGCTPDTQEENYKDYTTYFFAALAGKTRMGQSITPPDYDHDGKISMAEAHAYVQLTSDTIDIPVCTSDVLLRQFSKTRDDKIKDLITSGTKFETLIKETTPDRRAVLEGLSKQLDLKGDDRAAAARALADSIDKQRKGLDQRPPNRRNDKDNLRNQIRARVMMQWPEIGNPYNPASVNVLTREAAELVKVIETHPAFKQWDALMAKNEEMQEKSFDLERKWVKCQRFLYVSDSVALEANLSKFASKLIQDKYKSLRAAECGTVGSTKPTAAAAR